MAHSTESPRFFLCPHLHSEVELTTERAEHIRERHPEIEPIPWDKMRQVIADPDQIRRSRRFGNARLFSRWFDDLRDGKHFVVIVVSDPPPQERHWIITAYVARRLTEGDIAWKKS